MIGFEWQIGIVRRILNFDMKTLTLTTIMACGLSLAAGSVSARTSTRATEITPGQYHIALVWPWSGRLSSEINHLNRMRGHVRWLFRNYRSSRQLQRDFFAVSRDIDRINAQFKQGQFNARRLRRDIERARWELHRIESALKVKPHDRYRWR